MRLPFFSGCVSLRFLRLFGKFQKRNIVFVAFYYFVRLENPFPNIFSILSRNWFSIGRLLRFHEKRLVQKISFIYTRIDLWGNINVKFDVKYLVFISVRWRIFRILVQFLLTYKRDAQIGYLWRESDAQKKTA